VGYSVFVNVDTNHDPALTLPTTDLKLIGSYSTIVPNIQTISYDWTSLPGAMYAWLKKKIFFLLFSKMNK